jgi:hypothetical protein
MDEGFSLKDLLLGAGIVSIITLSSYYPIPTINLNTPEVKDFIESEVQRRLSVEFERKSNLFFERDFYFNKKYQR